MTTFVVLALLLVAVAAAWLSWPLLGRPRGADTEALGAEPKALPTGLALLVALPVLAAVLYQFSSNYQWNAPAATAAPHAGAGTGMEAGELAELTRRLAARLETEPGDVEGWRMLARTQLMTQDAASAVATLERAQTLDPSNALPLRLDFAEALILSEVDANVARARGLIGAELAVDPQNPKALWYTGVLAIRDGNQAAAVQAWQTMSAQADLPPQARGLVEQQLAALGIAPVAPATSAAGAAVPAAAGEATGSTPALPESGRALRIAVGVAPELAARVRPDAVLFVAAREKGIPGPPLAARRLSAGQLPLTVVLSDADAVIAGRNLSSVSNVEVIARVAFGGTAQTVAGDLIGSAEHAAGSPADIAVTIDRVAP
jgi:cytochrome c-type biogenesis protein CcmH